MKMYEILKIGGSVSAAGGFPVATWFVYDHLTSLYEVENKVINEDMKLTVNKTGNENKQLTIEAPKSTDSENNPKLPENYSWSCEITLDSTETNIDDSLKEKIQNNLYKDNSISDVQKKNKELLVRACSKTRKEGHSNTAVVGLLKLNKKEGSSNEFTFKDHLELDILLKEITTPS